MRYMPQIGGVLIPGPLTRMLTRTTPDDAAWHAATVARVLRGDTDAYAELVRAHRSRCLRYAYRVLGDQDEAEDVAQDAFVRAYRALGQCSDPGRFGAWLFSILVNRCRTALAKHARRQRLLTAELDGSEPWDETSAPAHSSDSPEPGLTLREVEAALETLPSAQREAFVLRHIEELSYEEMATITRTSVPALRMRVSRARDLLRTRLAEVYDGR